MELDYMQTAYPAEFCRFINANHIPRENIQLINVRKDYGKSVLCLYFWRKEDEHFDKPEY